MTEISLRAITRKTLKTTHASRFEVNDRRYETAGKENNRPSGKSSKGNDHKLKEEFIYLKKFRINFLNVQDKHQDCLVDCFVLPSLDFEFHLHS